MAKEESPSTLKDLQELQRKLSLLLESFQNNSKVVAFTKSPVGQYLQASLSASRFMSRVPTGGNSELFLRVFVFLFETREAVFHSFETKGEKKKKIQKTPQLFCLICFLSQRTTTFGNRGLLRVGRIQT
uniref:Uncharacterized protein n=1 Tax=Sciurus vulgaris TaxID=55149 RepID=A0A8D2DFL8_SCIVU